MTVNIKPYTFKKNKTFQMWQKKNPFPHAYRVWEDRRERSGSSVYFGDFSFLGQLWWFLLRASGKGWEGRRRSPEWWMGRVMVSSAVDLFWTLGAVRRPAQYWAKPPFCLHPSHLQEEKSGFCLLLGQSLTCPISVQSQCGHLRHCITAQHIRPGANLSPLQWCETSLLNGEWW